MVIYTCTCPFKTRVIWVPGIYIYIYICILSHIIHPAIGLRFVKWNIICSTVPRSDFATWIWIKANVANVCNRNPTPPQSYLHRKIKGLIRMGLLSMVPSSSLIIQHLLLSQGRFEAEPRSPRISGISFTVAHVICSLFHLVIPRKSLVWFQNFAGFRDLPSENGDLPWTEIQKNLWTSDTEQTKRNLWNLMVEF